MKLFNIMLSRKYFRKIILLVTITMTLTILILELVTYVTVNQVFLNKEYESSKKVLNQMKYNFLFMEQNISTICSSLYANSDISGIMNSTDNIDIYRLHEMRKVVLSSGFLANKYIQSICVYNSFGKQYFYTGKSLYFDDVYLKELIDNPDIPKSKPILRPIESDFGTYKTVENVLTFIMYETAGTPKRIDNAVIVNVKPEWILGNLELISEEDKKENDKIFIVNDKGEPLVNDKKDEGIQKYLYTELQKYKSANKESVGYFKSSVDGNKCFITYVTIENSGYILFKVQPVSEILKSAGGLRNAMIVVLALFVLFSVVVSTTITKKVYEPINSLVDQVTKRNQKLSLPQTQENDEILLLSNIYKYNKEKLNDLEQKEKKYRVAMKEYWLRKIIGEDKRYSKEEFETICGENSINLPYDYSYVVSVYKIDNFNAFLLNNGSKDRELLRFAITNISSELIGEDFLVEYKEVDEEQIVLIIGFEHDRNDMESIYAKTRQAQQYILQYFDISISASVSEKADGVGSIFNSYQEALKNLNYRFIYGNACICTPEKISKHGGRQEGLKELEKELTDDIKLSSPVETKRTLDGLFGLVSLMKYEDIFLYLIGLVDMIRKIYGELEFIKSSVGPKLEDLKSRIGKSETMEEFIKELYGLLMEEYKDRTENQMDAKYNQIIRNIVDHIHRNYADTNLNTSLLADAMNIDSRKLSKMFKAYTGLNIANYITDVRIKKAAELLENTSLNVYEVMEKVGVENESYFYKVFKSRFGYTPKEYSFLKK